MELSRSFRLQGGGGGPLRLSAHRRSGSSLLLSEAITVECARISAYERLSESMRRSSRPETGCPGHSRRTDKKCSRALALVGKIFSLRKAEGSPNQRSEMAARGEKKLKKRSPWLPDPERRWPVQGW